MTERIIIIGATTLTLLIRTTGTTRSQTTIKTERVAIAIADKRLGRSTRRTTNASMFLKSLQSPENNSTA